MKKILRDHGAWQNGSKSQFPDAFSTEDGVRRLLAEGLGALAEQGRVLTSDHKSRVYDVCTFPAAVLGWYHCHGRYYQTRRFVVVSRRTWNPEEHRFEFDVITAYPIRNLRLARPITLAADSVKIDHSGAPARIGCSGTSQGF